MDAVVVNHSRWNRPVWLVAAVSFGLAVFATWSLLRLQGDVARLHAELAALEQEAAAEQATAATGSPQDFVTRLPPTASADAFFKHLQRSATQSGVSLQLVTANASAATPQTLGRVDLSISLQGNYVAIKDVLAQTLALRGVVLQRLVLQRHASAADVQGQVDLMLMSQPLRAAER